MARATQQLSFGEAFDSQPEHRLFFGIRPDARAAGDLVGLMERLRGNGVMSGRPVDRHRLHATLHHLGDFVDQIRQACC